MITGLKNKYVITLTLHMILNDPREEKNSLKRKKINRKGDMFKKF